MAYRPQIKTSNGVTDLPLDAETVKGKTILEQTYPVGAIYISVDSTSPASLFGGTWQQLKDRFLLGAGDTYTNGNTGGEATHQLSVNEMPSHSHAINTYDGRNLDTSAGYWFHLIITPNSSRSADVPTGVEPHLSSTGGGQAHNNMPPYLTVYMWKRTA